MKILFIVTRGDLTGGAQIHVRDMAKRLKSDNHIAEVLTGSTGDFTDQLSKASIPWRLIPSLKRNISPLSDIKACGEIKTAIKEINPDIVSTHTAKAGMVGRIAAIMAKYPVLFTAHGWQFADGIPIKQSLPVLIIEKLISPKTDRIITVSDYDYNLALRKRAASQKKLKTIHNGLPFLPEIKRDSTGKRPARLIMIARFQPQKDHTTLFRALSSLSDLRWVLELVGDGPDFEALKTYAETTGIADRIQFLGQRTDVPELLAKSDIFVLISHWEGFPRSIVEAMRASLPVISSNVGGCRESVEDGKTGILVEENDIAGLTSALRELIENRQLALKMGKNGRQRYERLFTFEHMYEVTVEEYKRILARQ